MQFLIDLIYYIFSPTPSSSTQLIYVYILLSFVLISTSVFLRLYIRRHNKDKALRRSFREYPGKFIMLGILFLIYTLFRYTGLPFFSMRVILIALFATIFYFCHKLYLSLKVEYPRQKKMLREQEERSKYLPRKKHR